MLCLDLKVITRLLYISAFQEKRLNKDLLRKIDGKALEFLYAAAPET